MTARFVEGPVRLHVCRSSRGWGRSTWEEIPVADVTFTAAPSQTEQIERWNTAYAAALGIDDVAHRGVHPFPVQRSRL